MKTLMKRYIGRILFLTVLTGLFVVVLNGELRSQIRGALRPNYRVILAVATADLNGRGSANQILKIKTQDGLFLEVYGTRKDAKHGDQTELLASVKLPDKKDGYFTFNGQVTNLAIDDLNGDKNLEILATTFDNNLVAHINAYRFLPGQKQLELVKLN